MPIIRTPNGPVFEPLLTEKQKLVYYCNKRYILVTGPRLCMHPETPIFTPTGMVRLKDFEASTGRQMPVTAFNGLKSVASDAVAYHRNPSRKALELTLSTGRKLVMAPEHEMFACFDQGKPECSYISAEKMVNLVKSGVFLPVVKNAWKDTVDPKTIQIRFNDGSIKCVELDRELAYFIGAMVGDGNCQTENRSVGFTKPEQECYRHVVAQAERLGSKVTEIEYEQEGTFRITGEPVRRLVEELGINCLSKHKRVPACILSAGKDQISSFLSGLFDTDGCAMKNSCIEYCSASEGLANDVLDLLSMFGIQASIRFKIAKCAGKEFNAWMVNLYGENADEFFKQIGFRISRKQNRRSTKDRFIPHHSGYPSHIKSHLKIRKIFIPKQSRSWWRSRRFLTDCHRMVPCEEKLKKIVAEIGSDPFIDVMLSNRSWVKVESIKKVESELVDITVNDHSSYIVAGGHPSHNCGKSVSVAKRLIKHAWETGSAAVPALVLVVSDTISTGLGGPWNDIWKLIQEWVDEGVASEHAEFQVVKPPSTRGSTRQHYFQILNQFGGVAEFQLRSMEFEGDIEELFLSTRYSAIYFSELQNFHRRSTFDISSLQLRIMGIPYDQHMWIADTNPPEEGDEHFAHKIFFEERVAEEPPESLTTDEEIHAFRRRQMETALFQFSIDDNPLADPREISNVKMTYANDPEGWDRFVKGLWTRSAGHSEKWFSRDFRPSIHIKGECHGTIEEDWDVILPEDSTNVLYIGLDPGESNHAAAIIQKRSNGGITEWDILSENVSLGEDIVLEEWAEPLSDQMDLFEKYCGRPMEWLAWGDTSMEKFRSNGGATDSVIIEVVCGNRFSVQPASGAKLSKALRRRITTIKSLLQNNRIFVSAQCSETIRMFKDLRRGKRINETILKGDPRKHIFDAISYVIYSEMLADGEIQDQSGKTGQIDPSKRLIIMSH